MRIAATPTSVQKIAKVFEKRKGQLKWNKMSSGGSGIEAHLNVSEPFIAKGRDGMANKCDSNEDQK